MKKKITYSTIFNQDVEEFLKKMSEKIVEKELEHVYDYINKVEYNEEKSDREGSTH